MSQRLSLTALLVRDYDEAIDFYVRKVGFQLREDTDQGGGKRWVVVGPDVGGAGILLAKPTDGRGVGEQGAGRVFLFLETDDFARDHRAMLEKGVGFREAPRFEPYGTVAVRSEERRVGKECRSRWSPYH